MFGKDKKKDKDKDKKKDEKEETPGQANPASVPPSQLQQSSSIPATVSASSGGGEDKEQIDASFAALLPELGIPALKQQEMLKWDVEKKRQLISIHGDKVLLF